MESVGGGRFIFMRDIIELYLVKNEIVPSSPSGIPDVTYWHLSRNEVGLAVVRTARKSRLANGRPPREL